MHTAPAVSRPSPHRLAAGLAAVALLALALFELLRHGEGWWQFFALGAAPDLALLLGAGRGLAPGQLHPRAVPLYNALHRAAGPLLLGAAAVAGLAGTGWLVGALAWGVHIAIDRAAGYGLRTRDGHQRR